MPKAASFAALAGFLAVFSIAGYPDRAARDRVLGDWLDERTVEQTARALKDQGLLRIVWSGTGRR